MPPKVTFSEPPKTEEKPMTEQMYLDLVDQLKDKYDMNEYMMKKIQIQNMELKKDLMTAFGCIRILDGLIHNSYNCDGDIVTMCESLRAHLSNTIEDLI